MSKHRSEGKFVIMNRRQFFTFVSLIALISVALILGACQKNTYELANSKKPVDAPEYTVQPDLNAAGER